MAKHWYSVSVLSNYEKKVAEQIRQDTARKKLGHVIEEVLVPEEEVIVVRRGKKVAEPRRFMPGYVLIKMEMTDEGYHLVNSINRVTGFLGPQGKPIAMHEGEVQRVLGRVEEGSDVMSNRVVFETGEKVRVNGGPFEGFDGTVEDVDDANQRLKVSVSIFGRLTRVDLEYGEVSKQT